MTYTYGKVPLHMLNMNIDILEVPNKGYNIGAKLCVLEYLKQNNCCYKYILFLHSEINVEKRLLYFDCLIKTSIRIKLLKYLLQYKKIIAIFPNNISFNNGDLYLYNEYNYKYMLELLQVHDNYRVFSGGDCFICEKPLLDFIFGNSYKLFYNICNDDISFDVNWVNIFYNINSTNIYEVYQQYVSNNLYGNNIMINKCNKKFPDDIINGNCERLLISKNGLADAMIEYVFEKLWMTIIHHLHGNYIVLDRSNICDHYNIRINALYFPQFHRIPSQ